MNPLNAALPEAEWSPQGPVLELPDDESWERLRERSLGHLGVSVDGQPEIYPVNYVRDRQTVLFRTAAGEKLRDLMINRRVAFEVDAEVENGTRSVVVSGRASVLPEELPLSVELRDSMPPWIPTQEAIWVCIVAEHIRSRQFEHHLPIGRI
jgi:nitroimidazol reductase NimA-like FMN-containing flavoprotein (pyridoxamine 5'-phosphate oxidase superfamily)